MLPPLKITHFDFIIAKKCMFKLTNNYSFYHSSMFKVFTYLSQSLEIKLISCVTMRVTLSILPLLACINQSVYFFQIHLAQADNKFFLRMKNTIRLTGNDKFTSSCGRFR